MSEATTATTISANLTQIRTRINEAARRTGRSGDDVTLVAVSKTKPIELIRTAYEVGQRDFGENRLEELWEKVEAANALGLTGIRWHLIGTIQSRKSSQAVGPFTLLHAVDRLKIAQRLSRDAEAAGCVLSILLEVNVSGEASKQGFSPDEVRHTATDLLALPALQVAGLMTVAPLVDDAATTRPVFRALRMLRDELRTTHPAGDWSQLSMGMTNDFEVAVEEGATLVRVGSAIFGSR